MMYKQIFKQCKNLIIVICGIGLTACGGGSSGISNGSGAVVPSNDANLGILVNGSIVYVSSAKYTLPTYGYVTGTIGLNGGDPGYIGLVSFAVKAGNNLQQATNPANLPLVTMNPGACTLNSSNLAQTCQLIINGNGATPGNYIITPTIVGDGRSQQLNSFMVVVSTSGDGATIGNLAVNLANSAIQVNTNTTATISLSNSANIAAINVSITSIGATKNMITITPSVCRLSSSQNSCTVTITGNISGVAQVIATGVLGTNTLLAYKQIAVNSQPGNITLSLNPADISKGQNSTATVTLNNAIDVNNLIINVTSSDPEVADVMSSSCTIPGSVAPNNSCTVTLGAIGRGETTISATRQDLQSTTATSVLRVLRSIFYTTDKFNGNLGGVSGADTSCNNDQQAITYGGTYKAFIVDGVNRVACTTPNCSGGIAEHTDWVVQPQASYIFHMTPSINVSRDTNLMSLFLNESGVVANDLGTNDFPAPPQNEILFSHDYWTGLFSDYTAYDSCNQWSSSSSQYQATIGDAYDGYDNYQISYNFLVTYDSNFMFGCGIEAYLMCVEQ